jgi:hypothetical protein
MGVTPFKSEIKQVYLGGRALGILLSNKDCVEARDARWRLLSCSQRTRRIAGKTFVVITSLSVAPILDNTDVLRLSSFTVVETYQSCLFK